jgi:hypothetical protein
MAWESARALGGKTQSLYDKNEPKQNLVSNCGFGTTELTVLRPSGRVNNEFLHYITISRERMSENDEIVTRYMDDDAFQKTVFPLLAKEIYEDVLATAEKE